MDKLSLAAAINALSYGIVGHNMAVALYKELGAENVSLFPINPDPRINTSQEHAAIIQQCINNGKTLNFDVSAPCVRIWHQNDMSQRIGRGKFIGWPIFELNKFNELELLHLRSCDELVVCSEWAKKVIEDNGIDLPCHVVPLGVDRDIFKPEPIQSWEPTRYLIVGKIEVRKAHDVICQYFNDAFDPSQNIEIYLNWTNHFLNEDEVKEWEQLYKSSPLGDKIKFIPFLQQPQQVNALYNSVDCVVSLSRAEGWNLPLLEALSCGKYIIATDYSGHTEFLDGEIGYPIDIDELETAYDGKWFFGQGEWAVLGDSQKDQFIEYARKIHKKKQNNELTQNDEGILTAMSFSWENSAKKLIKAIL